MKKIYLILALILLVNLFSACGANQTVENDIPVLDPMRYETLKSRGFLLYVGVLFDSDIKSAEDVEYLSRLSQAKNLGLRYFALDINEDIKYEGFNILFLDDSLLKSPSCENIIRLCLNFAEAGGFVYAENAFLPMYDKLTMADFKTSVLEEMPLFDEISFPSVPEDMREMQEILSDYMALYISYDDSLKENRLDYGYSLKNRKGLIPLSSFEGGILSAIAPTENGATLFLPDILPDKLARQNFDLKAVKTGVEYYSDSSLSAARLMESAFMAYAARATLGFSLERNPGTYTRPSISLILPIDMPVVRKGMQIDLISRANRLGLVPSYSVSDSIYLENGPFCVLSYLESKGSFSEFAESKLDLSGISGSRLRTEQDLFVLKLPKYLPDETPDISPLESAACFLSCTDFNGDRGPDFLFGNSRGDIMLSMGNMGTNGRYVLGPPFALKSEKFKALRVNGPSAPIAFDINFDGVLDIICGTGDGKVLWFEGFNGINFKPRGELLSIPEGGRIIPAIADLNSDRYPDILLSTESGKLLICFGKARGGFSEEFYEIDLPGYDNKRLSPLIYDINSDKLPDILLGTEDGYILKLIQNPDGSFSQAGYVESAGKNIFGDNRAYFGSYASPAISNLNFDLNPDIVVAGVCEDLAVPINTIPATYLNLIVKAASELKHRGYYVGLRPGLGTYSEAHDEIFSVDSFLGRIKSRFDYGDSAFGADVFGRQINIDNPEQSFSSVFQSKASWISSYCPSELPTNALALPFYFTRAGKPLLLVQNSAESIDDSLFASLSAKYDLPLKLNLDNTDADNIFTVLEQASEFKFENFYTSLMENQLVFALTAALNFELKVEGDAPVSGKETELLLIPQTLSNEDPLYLDSYSRAVGAVMTFSDSLRDKTFGTDADIYYRDGNKLYFSLNRAVRIFAQGEDYTESGHIVAVNLPCKFENTGSKLDVEFLESGYKELVYKGKVELLSYGWQKIQKDDYTYFFSDGSSNRLIIRPIGN